MQTARAADSPGTDSVEQPGDTLQVGSVVISQVTLAVTNTTVSIANVGGEAVDLNGWFLCHAFSYWPFPSRTISAGETLVIHAGAGVDTDGELFASGSFGFRGDGQGSGGGQGDGLNRDIGLYRDGDFGNAGSIASYVSWGGTARKSVAQAAGIWGDADVTASLGDTIQWLGSGTGADAYSVAAPTVDALPATGSGGLATTADGKRSALRWAIVAAGVTMLAGLYGTATRTTPGPLPACPRPVTAA